MTRPINHYHLRHAGRTALICGLGPSLATVKPHHLESAVVFGVNDIARRNLSPHYLVVLNRQDQFPQERWTTITRTKTRHTTEDGKPLVISHMLEREQPLERAGFCRITFKYHPSHYVPSWDPDVGFGHGSDSPFTAAQLAIYMGCRRIGLIGVDFSPPHALSGTHMHHRVNPYYTKLMAAIDGTPVRLYNLSGQSRLTVVPSLALDDFISGKEPS